MEVRQLLRRNQAPVSEQPGCIIVDLPEPSVRPQLSATWQGRVLVLRLRASNTRDPVSLRVVGRAKAGLSQLAASLHQPDRRGSMDTTVRLPVRSVLRRVCAEAVI